MTGRWGRTANARRPPPRASPAVRRRARARAACRAAQFEQAIGVNAALNTTGLLEAMNAALATMHESGDMGSLASRVVEPVNLDSQCAASKWNVKSKEVTFGQVAGLW